MKRPLLIGITGGSGAGKSTLANGLIDRLGEDIAVRIPLDEYFYKDAQTNNSPEAVDFARFCADIDMLLAGKPVVTPRGKRLVLGEIIILEGHLLLADANLFAKLDLSIYVDLDREERLLRRIERNVGFGMELQEIIAWYRKDVKGNFAKYVKPQKGLCDIILWGDLTKRRIDLLAIFIKSLGLERRPKDEKTC